MRSVSPFLLCALWAFAAASGRAQDERAGQKATFLRICGSCHKPETVTSARRSKAQWVDSIEKMIARGAKATEDEFGAALDYLVADYGKVNVNRAPAAEIAEVLHIPDAEADLIVKHRRANGNFEDYDALAKVAGVDVKSLEKAREAIAY